MSDDHGLGSNRRVRQRYRQARRFKALCLGAVILAMGFLVFFFVDMIRQGYPAFQQAEILVPVTYNEQTVQIPPAAVPDEYRSLVSRGWLRGLPRQVARNPALMGRTVEQWVLADAEVDQYLKGHHSTLGEADKRRVAALYDEGEVRLAFNRWFFTNGDSKLPEMAGIRSALIGSLYVIGLTLAFSFPIGAMTAIYLEEFAPDNRFTRAIEVNINNLAAIPSIIYGLLGLALFINFMGVPRSSALVGGLTLGLMTLPIIIISTRAALRAVPQSIREGAAGVGASPWQVVWYHVLPLSLPGMLTGTIIGLAQAMGETAPLLLVGMMAFIPDAPGGINDAATVLPAQIFTWSGTSLRAYVERTAAAILVLLAVILVLNAAAVWMRHRFERKW